MNREGTTNERKYKGHKVASSQGSKRSHRAAFRSSEMYVACWRGWDAEVGVDILGDMGGEVYKDQFIYCSFHVDPTKVLQKLVLTLAAFLSSCVRTMD